MEASNLSDREFRIMVVRILNSMKKDIETIKKDQSEIKNTISGINITLERINSRLDEAIGSNQCFGRQGRKNTQAEQEKEF